MPAVADDAPGHVGIAAKAVPEQRVPGKTARLKGREGLGLGIAAMDDHGFFQLAGQLQLVVQGLVLDLFGAVVPVEIEPDLAHGAQAPIPGKGVPDGGHDLGRALLPVTGMDAQHEEDLGVRGEIRALLPPGIGMQEDVADGGHTGGTGAGQHLLAVGVEFLAVQMGVAVTAHAGQGLGQGVDTFNFLVAHG